MSWFQESERERNEDKHRSQKVRDRREIEQKEAEMKVVTEPIEGINQHPDDGMSPFSTSFNIFILKLVNCHSAYVVWFISQQFYRIFISFTHLSLSCF